MHANDSEPSLRRNFTIVVGVLCGVMILLIVLATTLANSAQAANIDEPVQATEAQYRI